MNVLLLLAIVFALFIAVDIAAAILFKIKRSAVRNISLSALIVLSLFCTAGGIIENVVNAETDTKKLFTAYNYIIDDAPDKAVKSIKDVSSVHADMVMLLADCRNNNYSGAFIGSDDLINSGRLNNDEAELADKVYALARKMTGLSEEQVSADEADEQIISIAKSCIELLKVNENQKVEYLSEFQRATMLSSEDYSYVSPSQLKEMLLSSPDDTELLKYSIKYYNANGQYELAAKNARTLLEKDGSVENAVLYSDVMAQEIIGAGNRIYDYNYGYDYGYDYGYGYDEEESADSSAIKKDKEIDDLLKLADEAEKSAASYDADSARYDELMEMAEKYRSQADGIRAQRIINWLKTQTPLFGDNSGTIDLQISRLYIAGGETEKAKEILNALIKRSDSISEDSPIKEGLDAIKRVYVSQNVSDEDISDAISMIMGADIFLDNTVLCRGYTEFLNKVLKYERMSVFISRVDTENYPTVRAFLNVNGRKNGVDELADDFTEKDFSFNDNGFDIPSDRIKRITDDINNIVSIALVIDGSGSMDGTRIENARKAVESCIDNLDPETQMLSVVTYSNSSTILAPLTNDKAALIAGMKQIYADGGTVISSGLLAGLETLKDAVGTKAIILMTDGEDGSPSTMDAAIEAAKKDNVAVFTVSTGGGERDYMENIAERTGGTYMEALSDNELANIYTSLQNYIVNNYCFEYTVENGSEANPRLLSVGLTDYGAVSCRSYAHSNMIISGDGCYVSRSDANTFELYYAEPSMISAADAKYGTSIFIKASAPTDGIKMYINDAEVTGMKTVGDNIAFVLQGDYESGALDITVKLADNTVKRYRDLIYVSDDDTKLMKAQTIKVGSSSVYADYVKQENDSTYRLSGNVVLNGYIYAETDVVLSGRVLSSAAGRIAFEYGSLSSNGGAFCNVGNSSTYYGAEKMKVLDYFAFDFEADYINYYYSSTGFELPGLGTVNGSVEVDGTELLYHIGDDYMLSQLQNNLNYAINNIGITEGFDPNTAALITGIESSYDGYGSSAADYGIRAYTEDIEVRINRYGISIKGEGYVRGYIGATSISEGIITIDSDNADELYTITGTVDLGCIKDYIDTDNEAEFTIASFGVYPDKLDISNDSLNISASGLRECFIGNAQPDGFDTSVSVYYPISLNDEPYSNRVSQFISDVSLSCDKIEFICTPDRYENAVKLYNSSEPEKYILIKDGKIEMAISGEDEYSLFSTDFGGEISGIAAIDSRNIVLHINVDGHLDNSYFGVKHDGKSELDIELPRNARSNSEINVTIMQDETLAYRTTISGGLIIDDGFRKNVEE